MSPSVELREIGLPSGLFADVAPKVLAGWRGARGSRRICVRNPAELRMTLLAALPHTREREITDERNSSTSSSSISPRR